MANEKKHSRIGLLGEVVVGNVLGLIAGSLEGALLSLAVPTSIRDVNDNLDKNLNEVFVNSDEKKVGNRLGKAVYHYTRLVTRFGIHGTAMYKMVEDISNGGDIKFGLLAIPNLISAGYEIYRSANRKKNKSFY